VRQIVEFTGMSTLHTCKILYGLIGSGLLENITPEEEEKEADMRLEQLAEELERSDTAVKVAEAPPIEEVPEAFVQEEEAGAPEEIASGVDIATPDEAAATTEIEEKAEEEAWEVSDAVGEVLERLEVETAEAEPSFQAEEELLPEAEEPEIADPWKISRARSLRSLQRSRRPCRLCLAKRR
jgi:hypothetical protein